MDSELYPEERRPRRRSSRAAGSLEGGLVLILLGVVFLLQQLGGFKLHNWWAIFILIPALTSLGAAAALYRRSDRFTYAVRSSLFGGLIPLAVALIFLFDLSWSIFWPLFLILPGLGMLFSGIRLGTPDEPGGPLAHRLYQPWLGWVGASVTLLGVTFLLMSLNLFEPSTLLKNWWGIFILLPAVGGAITAVRLLTESGSGAALIANAIVTAAVGLVGVFALLGVNWNLLTPILLIAAGLALLFGFLGRSR